MMMLSSRLTEVDVSTILTVLNCKFINTAVFLLFLLQVKNGGWLGNPELLGRVTSGWVRLGCHKHLS